MEILTYDSRLCDTSKAYRRAFAEHAGKTSSEVQTQSPTDEGSVYSSPYAVAPPKHRNRGTYIQRWKVLRDRNKSLPKLDFNAKASGTPKKFQGAGSFSRSQTYDSMKLPSISTCSVITGVSGKSVHSDGYRRKEDKTLQEQHSDSYNDLSNLRDYRDIKAYLSKSLQSLNHDERRSPTHSKPQPKEESKPKNSHRYESISYKKHLLKRHLGNNGNHVTDYSHVTDGNKRNKESNGVLKAEKEKSIIKTDVQKEYMYVKDHTKELPKLTIESQDTKVDKLYSRGIGPLVTAQPVSPNTDVLNESKNANNNDVKHLATPNTEDVNLPETPNMDDFTNDVNGLDATNRDDVTNIDATNRGDVTNVYANNLIEATNIDTTNRDDVANVDATNFDDVELSDTITATPDNKTLSSPLTIPSD
ncbi:hypothetical protein ACF0H5_012987 [Mactra antiquata]